jgi:glycosyltransferase involved in cell wall biosynthesis
MRVHVIDPSAYTPPYDHALCAALSAAGVDVQLHTSRFAHGEVSDPAGYARRENFYRVAARVRDPRARRAVKLVEHVPDMLRYRRAARAADVAHFQWLTVQHVDGLLLPVARRTGDGARARRPALVLTAHDVLPREPRPGQRAAQRRLYERFDAVVVHSEHGRARLVEELGVESARVHVIPHGALAPWEGRPAAALPPELVAGEGPVVLFFGLLRPYKGLDVLLEAWDGMEGAELWIVGMPRMDLARLRGAARPAGGPARMRWLTRFVSDGEMLAVMRRASLLVLPYREIDQSGVAFAGLGAGLPLLLSDVGGFPELAATGAARTFPAGDAAALRAELRGLLGDEAALSAMATAARAAAAGAYAWESIAGETIALYDELLSR